MDPVSARKDIHIGGNSFQKGQFLRPYTDNELWNLGNDVLRHGIATPNTVHLGRYNIRAPFPFPMGYQDSLLFGRRELFGVTLTVDGSPFRGVYRAVSMFPTSRW